MFINKQKLLAALRIANRVVSAKSSFAILSAIRLDGKNAVMQATDLEIGVEIPLEMARTDEDYVLSARRFTDIVKSLDGDDVQITGEVTETGSRVNINGLFDIYGLPVGEFPEFAIPDGQNGFAAIRKAALKNVIPATTQRYLAGVYFDGKYGKAVATDGHRLHMEPIKMDGNSFMVGVKELTTIISSLGKDEEIMFRTGSKRVIEREASDPPEKDTLDGLKKAQLISLAEDYFGVTYSDKEKVADIREWLMIEMQKKSEAIYSEDTKNVVVKTENATFVMRPLESRFPDYQAAIPEKSAHTVTVKKGEFLAAVKQALTMANERYRAVKLTFNGKGTIEMESVNPDIGEYRRLTVPMNGNVDPAVEAGFNPMFLRDIMETAEGNDTEITLGVTDNSKPLTFNHGSFEGLVMPMQV